MFALSSRSWKSFSGDTKGFQVVPLPKYIKSIEDALKRIRCWNWSCLHIRMAPTPYPIPRFLKLFYNATIDCNRIAQIPQNWHKFGSFLDQQNLRIAFEDRAPWSIVKLPSGMPASAFHEAAAVGSKSSSKMDQVLAGKRIRKENSLPFYMKMAGLIFAWSLVAVELLFCVLLI